MEDSNGQQLFVADAMDGKPWVCSQDTKVDEALLELSQKQIESCVIIDENASILGSLDIHQLTAAQFDGKKRQTLAELLPQAPFMVSPQAELLGTVQEMKKRGLTIALVMEGSNLLGELRLSGIGARLPELLKHRDIELSALRADRERKDEYLGLVSHDMRAPLTVIALSTDYLLADESVRSLSTDQKSFVERIKRNGEIAASMIHDILDVVRLEQGFCLDYQTVRFSQLLDESLQNLQIVAAKKHITFQSTHDEDIQVVLDPNRMRQVIENLLINAIKFSPHGGQIFLRSFLTQKATGTHLAFQVRDQGQGIRKEDEAKVFEAFVQSGRSKHRKEGVGLGLAIVRKFIEFHQGTIELDGGWQKGATITIFVPKATLDAAIPSSQPATTGPVILLVEDDESIREFYKQALEDYKYHVIEAADGAEGLALFQQHVVDLVLSDIRMPHVDGIEMLVRIRNSGSNVPVILCSGYYVGLENDLTKSDHKPNRIINKPFKIRDMVDVIEDQLRCCRQAS